MELSKRERRRLKESGEEAPQAKVETIHHARKKTPKLKIILWSALILIVIIVSYSAYSLTRPGPLDDFAKCLTEKGAVVYGAIDWCHYTQAQKGMFGKSWKYLDYQDHTKLAGIKKTPTWVIKGVWYENVQSFDKLSSITGCKINGG